MIGLDPSAHVTETCDLVTTVQTVLCTMTRTEKNAVAYAPMNSGIITVCPW